MAMILYQIRDFYNYVFYDLCDYRSRDMFPSPSFILTILPAYIYFIMSLGPQLMKNRKPLQLRTTIMFYNLFQIFINIYIFYGGMAGGWLNEYSWTCQPVDMTDNPTSRTMLNAVWWYTVVKLTDLLDTVFFVLRKKERQISFLNVYHHTMMPIAAYWGLKYFPNGSATIIGVFNSIVHVVMYTYYLISGLGPKYQKYLWWKKYLTMMQLVQFAIIFLHQLNSTLNRECEYPKWISTLLSLNSLLFIYLFGSFYYVNYIEKEKKTTKDGNTNGFNNKTELLYEKLDKKEWINKKIN